NTRELSMEKRAFRVSGFAMVGVWLVLATALPVVFVTLGDRDALPGTLATVDVLLLAVISSGYIVINPNQARVVPFFGRYVGTVAKAGFHWTVPLSTRRRVSLRVSNFESARLKVSDADGNPVEIAAVIVWRVVDTASAIFGVDNYAAYVAVQAETAVR